MRTANSLHCAVLATTSIRRATSAGAYSGQSRLPTVEVNRLAAIDRLPLEDTKYGTENVWSER